MRSCGVRIHLEIYLGFSAVPHLCTRDTHDIVVQLTMSQTWPSGAVNVPSNSAFSNYGPMTGASRDSLWTACDWTCQTTSKGDQRCIVTTFNTSENINVSPKHIHRLKQPLSFLFSFSFLLLKRTSTTTSKQRSTQQQDFMGQWWTLLIIIIHLFSIVAALLAEEQRKWSSGSCQFSLCLSVFIVAYLWFCYQNNVICI